MKWIIRKKIENGKQYFRTRFYRYFAGRIGIIWGPKQEARRFVSEQKAIETALRLNIETLEIQRVSR